MRDCHACGSELDVACVIRTFHENAEVANTFYACDACDVDVSSVDVSTKEHQNWGDDGERLKLATVVGDKLGDGEFYKKGAFGFVREQGKIVAIMTFEGKEPEVNPTCDGFGRLDMEVTIEQEESDAERG
jgi:hypothetical protein